MGDQFSTAGFRVGILQSKANDIITVKIYQTDIQIQFSDTFNTLLGIAPGFYFTQRSTPIFVPQELLDRINGITPVIPPVPIVWNDRNQIFVCCNIIEPQLVGSKTIPLLRIIPVNETNTIVNIEFSPVLYLPLISEQLHTVKIDLTDEKGKHLDACGTPTTVVLSLRHNRL
jgi:hypothetical protein